MSDMNTCQGILKCFTPYFWNMGELVHISGCCGATLLHSRPLTIGSCPTSMTRRKMNTLGKLLGWARIIPTVVPRVRAIARDWVASSAATHLGLPRLKKTRGFDSHV